MEFSEHPEEMDIPKILTINIDKAGHRAFYFLSFFLFWSYLVYIAWIGLDPFLEFRQLSFLLPVIYLIWGGGSAAVWYIAYRHNRKVWLAVTYWIHHLFMWAIFFSGDFVFTYGAQ